MPAVTSWQTNNLCLQPFANREPFPFVVIQKRPNLIGKPTIGVQKLYSNTLLSIGVIGPNSIYFGIYSAAKRRCKSDYCSGGHWYVGNHRCPTTAYSYCFTVSM